MKNSLLGLICILIFIAGCGPFSDYTKSEAIDNATWPAEKVMRFEYLVKDTTLVNDVFINLRHTGIYKYSNVFLFVTILAPNGLSVKDTASFMLADEKGKWEGKGIGDVYDVKLAFKHGVRFSQSGNYTILIQHGMRDMQLKEITDIGICISKVEE